VGLDQHGADQAQGSAPTPNGRVVWRARYPDPDWSCPTPTAQIEREFRTKAEAEAWLTAQAHSVMTGTHVGPAAADLASANAADLVIQCPGALGRRC
jgi:hypothetical protein